MGYDNNAQVSSRNIITQLGYRPGVPRISSISTFNCCSIFLNFIFSEAELIFLADLQFFARGFSKFREGHVIVYIDGVVVSLLLLLFQNLDFCC